MIKAYERLDGELRRELDNFLCHEYHQSQLSVYEEEVEEFYDSELPPFYVGRQDQSIHGLLILDDVEEETAYGRCFTKDSSFITELKEFFKNSEIKVLNLATFCELPGCDYDLEYAEYRMKLSYDQVHLSNVESQTIVLSPITVNDQEFYNEVQEQVFDMDQEEVDQRFESFFSDSKMNGFVVRNITKQPIGICAYYEGETCITFFDLAIDVAHQGRGHGRGMLKLLFLRTKDLNKDYLLQVTSTNEAAMHLYQQNGFKITEKQLFYTLMV